MEQKIISAKIEGGTTPFSPPKVVVTLDSGESKTLFDYFPDEISFTAEEFIGKTEEEAHRLKYTKDLAYLRS